MKRDVKVGLFVAAVVCGLAAILLGGGLVSRKSKTAPPLRVTEGVEPSESAFGAPSHAVALRRTGAPLPADLAETVVPPEEPEPGSRADDPWLLPDDGGAGLPASEEPGLSLTNEPAPERSFVSLSLEPPQGPEAAGPGEGPFLPEGPLAEPPGPDWRSGIGPGEGDLIEPPRPGPGPEPSLGAPLPEAPREDRLGPDFWPGGEDERADARDGLGEEALAPPPRLPAPPADVAPAPARVEKQVYIVKENESYWTISKRLFGTGRYYSDILKANPDVNPKKLRPGQRIAIPDMPGAELRRELLAKPEELKPKKPRVLLAQDVIHVVKPGETLESISKKYYDYRSKWKHIFDANRDRIKDPKKLMPETEIVVPALTK
jgi:LysM repeat protein